MNPPSIEGLINLRGTVIPIVNLRKRFGLGHFAVGVLRLVADEGREHNGLAAARSLCRQR